MSKHHRQDGLFLVRKSNRHGNNVLSMTFKSRMFNYTIVSVVSVIIIIICSSYIVLYPRTSSKRFTYYYPEHTCTHQHLLNFSTEHTTRIHATRRLVNVQ